MNRIFQKECETSLEYTLPDYMGDVKKILTVSCTPVPSGKFASDGEVEFSGIVTYDLLYSDSEGKLTKLTANSDYDVRVPIDSSYIDSESDVRVANLSVRLTGPRKLIAKAILSNSVKISVSEEISVGGNAFDSESAETVNKSIKVENTKFGNAPEREYAEEAQRINGLSPDDIEIISTSGAVRILESTAVADGVLVKGEIVITSIIRTENEPPFAIRRYIPFEETVSIEGATPDMSAIADGHLTSVTSGVAEDGDGCTLTVNAIAEYSAMVSENLDMTVTTDAYLKNRDTECVYDNYSYTELVSMKNCEEEIEGEILRTELGIENAREILALSSEVRSLDKKINKNGFEISGELQFSGIACEISENNEVVYLPIKFAVPFSKNVNCGCQIPKNCNVECKAVSVFSDSGLDADKLYAKSVLKIAYRILKSGSVKRVVECNSVGDSEYSNKLSCVTVYYPEEGETLFEIAKKFHTTGAKIASDNKLTEQTLSSQDSPAALSGVKKLIIR